MRKKKELVIINDSLKEVVRSGVYATEEALFDYCQVTRDRLAKFSAVTKHVEDSLFDGDALIKWIDTLPTTAQKFSVYKILTEMMQENVDFLQKMHVLIADQSKFEHLKKFLLENGSETVKKDVELDMDKDDVTGVISIFKNELKRRMENKLRVKNG